MILADTQHRKKGRNETKQERLGTMDVNIENNNKEQQQQQQQQQAEQERQQHVGEDCN
jgi:hypothetical protein